MNPPEILYTSSAPAALDPEILRLAHDLSAIHGTVRITNEASGLHCYLACPACLRENGTDELSKMHLAVNLLKYMTTAQTQVGMCMKCESVFDLLDLLSMPSLAAQGYEHKPQVIVKQAIDEDYLETDAKGNRVPKSPGSVIPIMDLPSDHPAHMYIASRGYNAEDLAQQFDLSFCTAERNDINYRKTPGWCRATPQGRIIFYIKQKGVTLGWQARILEIENDGYIWYWHPYKEKWVAVFQVDPAGGKPIPLPEFMVGGKKPDMAKYIFPHGCVRNACLMGYDAVMESYQNDPDARVRWCGLVEGPMDAARFGTPFMAIMGKSLSEHQAKLLVEARFTHVIYVRDKDEAGARGAESVSKQLQRYGKGIEVKIVSPPGDFKDLGEMTTEAAREFVLSNL